MYNNWIFLFRRDLRIYDNKWLIEAAKKCKNLIPVFIFDDNILSQLHSKDMRVWFIIDALRELETKLNQIWSKLFVYKWDRVEILKKLIQENNIDAFFVNKANFEYTKKQDEEIKNFCEASWVVYNEYLDSTLADIKDVPVRKVYTPFYKQWINYIFTKEEDIKKINTDFAETDNEKVYSGLDAWKNTRDIKNIRKRLYKFDFCSYDDTRNLPYMDGTSKLSPYIRFWVLSIREIYNFVESLSCDTLSFQKELAWREFWYHISYNFPYALGTEFLEKRRGINWENNQKYIDAWKEAKTWYPIVDAGILQLKQEWWIHNRVRMILASFLTKDLLVDWRIWEKFFADYLMDYDAAVNIWNWQWATSVWADPKPLRIFNPILQSQKFDPDAEYIKKYIPELKDEPAYKIHDPLKYELDYYKPIVNHYDTSKIAKDRFLGRW